MTTVHLSSTSEVAGRADFSSIRYAQCWEDADVLLEALDIQPGDTCLSISSAGDNALAMLARQPARVVALDLNPAQFACLELRVAAYRRLRHSEMLELIGSRKSGRRLELYKRCRSALDKDTARFWDARPREVAEGIGSAGKFERYFALFRERILPLVHSRSTVRALLAPRSTEERERFYETRWDTWRWRLLFRLFFSRFTMGRLGRDPQFFRYADGDVAERILARTRYALTTLDPSTNPYVEWILTGRHERALPFALREENFDAIRANLDRLERRCESLETFLDTATPGAVNRFNLSDIFEYISPQAYQLLLERLAGAARPGARLAYWNMLARRSRPDELAHRLRPLADVASRLFAQDKAFFYSALVVEEVL